MSVALRRHCLDLCIASYDDSAAIHKFGNIEVMYVHEKGANLQFVIFRGSDEKSDWFTNFCFWPTNTKIGKFHSGFYNNVKYHLNKIDALIKPGVPIIVSGHSKGGAEAQLFNILSKYDANTVVTFGSPKPIKKIHDKSREEILRSTTTNYINPCDAVTKTPFWWHPLGKDVIRSIDVEGSDHALEVYEKFFEDV